MRCSHLIDVFALHPSVVDSATPKAADAASDDRRSRYQKVLRQALAPDAVFEPGSVSSDICYRDELLTRSSSARDPEVLLVGLKTVNRDHVGQVVAGFAGPQADGTSNRPGRG